MPFGLKTAFENMCIKLHFRPSLLATIVQEAHAASASDQIHGQMRPSCQTRQRLGGCSFAGSRETKIPQLSTRPAFSFQRDALERAVPQGCTYIVAVTSYLIELKGQFSVLGGTLPQNYFLST